MRTLRIPYFLSLLCGEVIAQYTAIPRWGQAFSLVNDDLFVYGGKTDLYNQYSYTSAPNNNDLLRLSLTSSFNLAAPPWQYLAGSSISTTSQGPAIAWSTLSAYNTSQLLLFGGEPGPNSGSVLPALSDSAAILNIYNRASPQWISEPQSWANQPLRSIYHSASSTGGKIWITGGEKADGSNNPVSDNVVFDPYTPSFSSLPSSNSPFDIYGHASIVLPNGSLILFGGYSQSMASMIPLSSIWMLDMTSNSAQWTSFSVQNTPLPTPRRGFAATIIDGGKVVIHGGSDALLQTTYSDGWMLDTTQNPMTWTAVQQLSQLGARRDHLAAAVGKTVLFAFGYGSSGPAPAALSLYNTSSDSWLSSFTPDTTINPPNTLPPFQSQTITGSVGNTYPPGRSTGSSTNSGVPGTTGSSGGSASGKANNNKLVIALGTVFGALGLIAGSILAVYFIRRQNQQNPTRFHVLGGSEDEEGSGAIPVAGRGETKGSFFTLTGRTAPTQRRDMLADEDTRYFNNRKREDSGDTSTYSRLEKPSFSLQGSLASLLSAGAMFGMGSANARRNRSQEPSNSSLGSSWYEKEPDPFSDKAALVPSEAFEPRHVDPFLDENTREYHDGDSFALSISLEATLNELPQKYLETSIPSSELTLFPSTEAISYRSSGTPSSESLDHRLHSGYSTIGIASNSSDEIPKSPHVRRSSILDASPQRNQYIGRSDSWWSKFAKTPFLDRHTSDSGRSRQFDFRDPNPLPRLGAIEEAESGHASRNPSGDSYGPKVYYLRHGRSVSSMKTAQTADSEGLEKIGTMDIVQRIGGSRHSSGDDDDPGITDVLPGIRPLSVVMSADRSEEEHEANNIWSGDDRVVSCDSSPSEIHLPEPEPAARPPTSPMSRPSGPRSLPPSRPLPNGFVSSRIQAYERRDAETSKPAGGDERSTRSREVRIGRRWDRTTVKYGFAPKSPLFVANPDLKGPSY